MATPGASLVRAADGLVEYWLGWTFPPAARTWRESGFRPDDASAYCARCGGSVGPNEANENGCGSCRGESRIADRVIRLSSYQPPLDEWVRKAKYERWTEMAQLMGTALGEAIAPSVAVDRSATIVVPIPMPWQRRLYRGVDHARVIADAAARVVGVDLFRVLSKANGPVQAARSATERRRGRRNWMQVKRRWGGWPLDRLHVILIDDVKTTGTTLRTAARLVRGLGAARVTAAVVAVTDDPARRSQSVVELK